LPIKYILLKRLWLKSGYYNEDGLEIVRLILSKADLFEVKVIFGEEKRDESG
jgi:hypothetical protein